MSGLQDWEILEQVGVGAHAVVHRAVRRDRPGRVVALKRLRPADHDAVDDLRREAAVLAELSHPAIAVLHEVLVERDEVVLVLALATGGSLSDRLARDGPMSWHEVADLGARLADGLAAAHDAGIVHRDVKPWNVLFGREDEPRLADFGLARLVADRVDEVVGSAGHLDPEVLNGGVPGARADQWSLAVVLWEALVGQPPFVGADARAVSRAADRDDRLPLPGLAPAAPPELVAAVERAMARDPAARFATARDFQGALSSIPANSPASPSASAPATASLSTSSPSPPSAEPGAGTDPADSEQAEPVGAGDLDRPDDEFRDPPDPTTSWGPRPPRPDPEPEPRRRRTPTRMVVAAAIMPVLVAGWAVVHGLARGASPEAAAPASSRPVTTTVPTPSGGSGTAAVPATSPTTPVPRVVGPTSRDGDPLPAGWTGRRVPTPCVDRDGRAGDGAADGSDGVAGVVGDVDAVGPGERPGPTTLWADVDGRDCSVPVRVHPPSQDRPGDVGRVLDVGGRGALAGRWNLGAAGGVVVLGDWDGDGDDTPAVVEPGGAVWLFADWAGATATPGMVAAAATVAVATDPDGRDHLVDAGRLAAPTATPSSPTPAPPTPSAGSDD